ncbi:MAG: hypothetical protein ABS81_11860 [Pseudonocardia sp. SCN 72-86]|nr:MAG: hypothetical protein ABS81_11860 [Pseudonocardia sp. SCN 72-86]
MNSGYSVRRTIAASPEQIWALLADGPRYPEWTPVDGGTEFAMEEVFSGPLAGLTTKVIPDMTESFGQFADGLKTAAERTPATD